MNESKLDSLLEQVHAELQLLDNVDEEGRKLLQDLEQDIKNLLQKSEDVEAESILDRMQRAVEQFEVKYPTLTKLLSEASAILSNAGI
ncbi:MAG: DUF4404 family protein [Anaerolineales bacterium]|jgi:TRAP-type C4-dicarboxylate transport system substrate-binding protein|nr:DUF4404 family protein [Anaerolineales bacterium]